MVQAQAPIASNPVAIANLVSMGFPEAECRSALEAANGNPDLAYEFLLNGVPEQFRSQQSTQRGGAVQSTGTNSAALLPLRNSPQLNDLKRLVQSNPAALPQVLNVIGQQSPELLEAIHANNDEFLALMNEPISATPAVVTPAANPTPAGLPAAGETAQLATLLQSLPAEQRAAFAQQLGMTPEQLQGFMQMISSLPPEQLSQLMSGAGASGVPEGAQVIRLTEEEHAAVSRLTQLGFTQQQAVQAYLACDKNEGLAANLLFDGGFGFDDEGGDDMYN